tara:strand:- start:299 stop:457 length:159 start_codon:yes stop_codon:yes gene_type:complete
MPQINTGTVMGDSAASCQDDVRGVAAMYLKDTSFGVRSAAAHVLTALACAGT